VAPDTLHHRGSATGALRELARAASVGELLDSAHAMWCGPTCHRDQACTFLHYPRARPAPGIPRTRRSPYNKDTADLFFLMGGEGYAPGTPTAHEMDFWSVLRPATALADRGAGARIDYTDWARKDDPTAAQIACCAARDAIQWTANWNGERYAEQPAFLHYVALSTICDDLCIPPLDLVSGRFQLYGRSVGDVIAALEEQGWGRDALHALLALVRQYVFQYAEKLDFARAGGSGGLHARLNEADGVWDAVLYRTHSANTYGCVIGAARLGRAGPCTTQWLLDSAICDAVSMDLCKSALDVYQHDLHQPTADERRARRRETAYHSVYLDLIDDLVAGGAPDAVVHFGHAGFLFVQIQERYHERRAGRRLPLRPALAERLGTLFGDEPVNSWTEQRFQAARAGGTANASARPVPSGPTGLGTSAVRLGRHG
jgi:hypothetical protein